MLVGKLDELGFLLDWQQWNEQIATELAHNLPCPIDDRHKEIIELIRQVYSSNRLQPANRALVKLIQKQLDADKAQSIYLMTLFGGNFAKEAARVAGLPKPPGCL